MDTKDKEINNLLQQGYSYREIASKLGISTRRIAEVKKACFQQETTSDKGFRPPENTFMNTVETNSNQISSNNYQLNLKNTSMENNENTFRKQETGIHGYPEVEIKKMELNHALEIRKLELHEREIRIQEEKLELEKDKLDNDRNKIEEEELSLQYRFRNLVDRCVDGDWGYDAAVDFFNDADALLDDVKKFAFIKKLDEDSIIDIDTLKLIHAAFDDFTEDWDKVGKSREIEFEQELKDALESSE